MLIKLRAGLMYFSVLVLGVVHYCNRGVSWFQFRRT